ncbi:MAG: ATP-dependent Clp endopeptidase proteolytic subunit ClpP [Candidatus Cryptobacteroides sp.]
MGNNEFRKFAVKGQGISSLTLDGYTRATDAYINPTIIEERKLNVASMDVFSRLLMDRIIFLGVPIDDDVANILQAQLLFLASTDPSADISLYINTPGGQVTSGLAIYDTMQIIEPDVATICTGMAASMGSVLLCAGQKGKRSCLPHSRVLIHQPLGGAQGQASDIMIAAKEIEKTRKELYDIISEHSGQPYEKVFADADRDYWMTAREALEYGMVDEILTKKAREWRRTKLNRADIACSAEGRRKKFRSSSRA